MQKTEFFETAVQQGFYGLHKGGLTGKKDNARKYWEDISIKTAMRKPLLNLLEKKSKLKIADFGCGSGEGYELLTHIPLANNITTQKDFILNDGMVDTYAGFDISPAMVEQGKANYSGKKNILFYTQNLSEESEIIKNHPFDVYFSSYSSPSHLSSLELQNLLETIFKNNNNEFVIALDLFGKFSPEWPVYWSNNSDEFLLYNMSWLYGENETDETIEDYFVRFWGAAELKSLINTIAKKNNRIVNIKCYDRSILIGRHMQTGAFNRNPQSLRLQINKLFDRDYRGEISGLYADIKYLDWLKSLFPTQYSQIKKYSEQWNAVIKFLDTMMNENSDYVEKAIEIAPNNLKEDLMMLKWLERNSSRFPVVDFWASIFGPQVACILRNLEINLPEAHGCGHGLFCVAEVK